MGTPTIGVLAVQGAFIEHERMLESLGARCRELRNAGDLQERPDGLILPGGESTVQGRILRDTGMFETIRNWIAGGLPVLATCVGLILLADRLSNDTAAYFQTLPVTVRRNAYGRQLGSFITTAQIAGIGAVPMHFIRAPYIEAMQAGVDVLAQVDGHIVAVRYKNQLGLAFHPEVSGDKRIHAAFLQQVCQNTNDSWHFFYPSF